MIHTRKKPPITVSSTRRRTQISPKKEQKESHERVVSRIFYYFTTTASFRYPNTSDRTLDFQKNSQKGQHYISLVFCSTILSRTRGVPVLLYLIFILITIAIKNLPKTLHTFIKNLERKVHKMGKLSPTNFFWQGFEPY